MLDAVVKFKEKDVPGATFIYSAIEKHSVLQLRRWLECRGNQNIRNEVAFVGEVRVLLSCMSVTAALIIVMRLRTT